MTTTIRLILALGPLAGYFAVLGFVHAGRRPRVVAGPVDFGCLAFGLGGVIAFGPAGALLVNVVFPRPNVSAWLAMASLIGLLSMMGASRARNRLVVYNVDGPALTEAVGRAMNAVAGTVSRTVRGFEDTRNPRGVTVETGRMLGSAVVEAYGELPEKLIEALRSNLASQLHAPRRVRTSLVALWFGLACGTLAILCVAVILLSRAETRAAIRR